MDRDGTSQLGHRVIAMVPANSVSQLGHPVIAADFGHRLAGSRWSEAVTGFPQSCPGPAAMLGREISPPAEKKCQIRRLDGVSIWVDAVNPDRHPRNRHLVGTGSSIRGA